MLNNKLKVELDPGHATQLDGWMWPKCGVAIYHLLPVKALLCPGCS